MVKLQGWSMAMVAVVALLLLAFVWHHQAKLSGGLTPAGSRRQMHDAALQQMDGGTWRLSEHRGQVVVINYWATWCGPCREETPGLVRLANELGPRGLAIVGVSLDEGDRGKVRAFAERFHVNYPVAFPAPMSQIAQGLEAVPTTILVDREGRAAKAYIGAMREVDLRTDVEALLAETSSRAEPK
jgi:cytochrome c biogenesis protein CcmG/thiol:disulfide interchange protein DsbE